MNTRKTKTNSSSFFTVAFIVLSLLGAVLFVKYFHKAFIGAKVPLKVDKKEAINRAKVFLEEKEYNTDGYKISATFETDEQVDFYLQRMIGVEKLNDLTKNKRLCLYYWRIRFFKPLQREEFIVGIAPDGELDGLNHLLPEDSPGKTLPESEALQVAQQFVKTMAKMDLSCYVLSSTTADGKTRRLDYHFIWKRQLPELPETNEEIMVIVRGGRVGFFEKYISVPETFTRRFQKERAYADLISGLAGILSFFLVLCSIVVLVSRLVKREKIDWKFGVVLGAISSITIALLTINNLHIIVRSYPTSEDWGAFLGKQLLIAFSGLCLVGIQVFLASATGKALDREIFTRMASDGNKKKAGKLKTLLCQCGVGYALAFLFLGYHTLFYLLGSKLGVWVPAKPKFSNLLLAHIPFLAVLGAGLYAALTEETLYRLFCIPFFKKYAKSGWIALLIPGLVWGMTHSSHIVYPVYTRVIEVTIVGIIYGLFFIRYGLMAVVVSHYLVDSISSTLIFIDSSMSSYRITMIMSVLMPVLVILAVSWLAPLALRLLTGNQPTDLDSRR